MKRKYFIYLITLISVFQIEAQNSIYYYYKMQKKFLTLDRNSLCLSMSNQFEKAHINNLSLLEYDVNIDNSNSNQVKTKYTHIIFNNTPTEINYYEGVNYLKTITTIETVNPNYITSDGQKIGMSNYFYVKLKNSSDYIFMQSLAQSKNIIIVNQDKTLPLWYTLKCTKNTIENTLDIANLFFETGHFDSSFPDFLSFENNDLLVSNTTNTLNNSSNNTCANDTDFSQQWGLNNGFVDGFTANSNNYNYDINACEAWNISQGAGVKVAILDVGVDLNNLDLNSNLYPLSYDSETGNSPSQIYSNGIFRNHGTHIAGIIGAVKNNEYQISGVAPQSKLVSISNQLDRTAPNNLSSLIDGINWAIENNVEVINNSWQTFQNQLIEETIENAVTNGRNGLGTIMVFCSGNNTFLRPNGYSVWYPSNSNPNIVVVGAMTSSGQRSNFSCYGNQLDVVAPGSNILSTILNNDLAYYDGTSMAAPHVAGVAALILSVNPCLSGKQVRDIIEKTAQKVGNYNYSEQPDRPNGTWNNEMGYGLVDAYAAVQLAQAMNSPTLDLMVRDSYDDFGIEPNTSGQTIWNSPDIWVRNQDDGIQIQEHQNPKYFSNGNLNYIYVRVTNKSCTVSNETDLLKVYFALNRLWLNWPNSWNQILPIGQITIPQIQPGQEAILSIPWNVPNPNSFPSNSQTFDGSNNFSLLTRIESSTDTMTFPETGNVSGVTNNAKLRFAANVRNNNNIAWKNVVTIEVANRNTTVIALKNLSNEIQNSYLELVKENNENGKPIYQEAEVSIKMDDILYGAWERGGKLAEQLNSTTDVKKKLVQGNNVILDNISLNPNEIGTLQVSFNFLTKEVTDKNTFIYHVIQRDKATGEIIGGETITIIKNQRDIFTADAGESIKVDINEPITISAAQISEPVIYNWYDTNGNLIFSGKDLTIATAAATRYKLEVIATADGFKDYSEVEVKLNPSELSLIAPNPATNNVTINYKVNETGTAYLMIISSYGTSNSSNNYILNTNSSETNIDISNYPIGFYTVALVCNGQIVNAKTLIKN